MSLRLTALQVARKEIQDGSREIPPDSNEGPFCHKYLSDAGVADGNPYCASAIGWLFKESARLNQKPRPFAPNPGALNLFRALQKMGWEIAKGEQQPGDLIFWRRGEQSSGKGHVEIIEFANEGRIQTIGFNHGSVADHYHYDADEWPNRFVGFIRVPG